MSTNYSLLFYLKKPKNYVSGPKPIYLRITADGIPKEVSTGRECDPTKWISQANRAKGTKEDVKALNAYLDTIEHKVANIHLQMTKNGEDITAESIKLKYLGKDIQRKTLLAVFLEHNEQMKALLGKGFKPNTLKGYKTSLFIGRDSEMIFLGEIAIRTVIMFVLILTILRLSGRRGVRQLTVFEVAIIISLGSAAGDPMFQGDIPIVHAVIVFICVILVYKSVTWLASRSQKITYLLEGKVLPVVEDGMFDIKHENDSDFSKMEFFSELRNLNVEHLGQVRKGLLEIDGTLSVLFYADEEVRYGLPLFPSSYKKVDIASSECPFACMYCGIVEHELNEALPQCRRCGKDNWTIAINTKRYS